MEAIKFLLCLLCVTVFWSSGLCGSDFLNTGRSAGYSSLSKREAILQVAESQLGAREATGKNDGVAVESYLHYTGNNNGDPWCASFVSWVYGKAGYETPRTAWSPGLFPVSKRVSVPQPADVFGIYFASLKRIAHCGIVKTQRGSWIITIEGNTNTAGSREGDGVYTKYRHIRTIKYFADWLKGGGL